MLLEQEHKLFPVRVAFPVCFPCLLQTNLCPLCCSPQQQQNSYSTLAAEVLSEVAECTRYKESKTYRAALVKVLLALPLDGRDVPAIKQLRAFAGGLLLSMLSCAAIICNLCYGGWFSSGCAA